MFIHCRFYDTFDYSNAEHLGSGTLHCLIYSYAATETPDLQPVLSVLMVENWFFAALERL